MKIKRMFIILLVVAVSALAIINIISMGTIFFNELTNWEERNKETGIFENKAKEYMRNIYDIEFTAELESDGFKRNVSGLDGSAFYFGHDKNIKEYIFKMKPITGNEISYITIHKNIKTNEVTIEEKYGSTYPDASYKLMHELELLKNEIREVVSHYDNKFEIINKIDKSIRGNNDKIYIYLYNSHIEENKKNVDCIKDITKLLEDRKTDVVINIDKICVRITKTTNIEMTREFFSFIKATKSYMKENYNNTFEIYKDEKDFSDTFTIQFNKKIKDEIYGRNKEQYFKLYKYLWQKCQENDFIVKLKFEDEIIIIDSYAERTLEEQYLKYLRT